MATDEMTPEGSVINRLERKLVEKGELLLYRFEESWPEYMKRKLTESANGLNMFDQNYIRRGDNPPITMENGIYRFVENTTDAFWLCILEQPDSFFNLLSTWLNELKCRPSDDSDNDRHAAKLRKIENNFKLQINEAVKNGHYDPVEYIDELISNVRKWGIFTDASNKDKVNLAKADFQKILKILKQNQELRRRIISCLEEIVEDLNSNYVIIDPESAGFPKSKSKGICQWNIIFFLLITIIALFYGGSWYWAKSPPTVNKFNIETFLKRMNQLYTVIPKETFGQYHKLLNMSLQSERSLDWITVYTLLHNGSEDALSMADDMARIAFHYFDKKYEFYKLDGERLPQEFLSIDYTTKFKSDLMERAALIVNNFEKIPSREVRKFHAICDIYSPFIESRLVILLVFKFESVPLEHELNLRQLRKLAETSMRKVWNDIEKSSWDALISRLSENIVLIK